MVKFKLIASAVLAVGVTTIAAANDVSTTAKAVIQDIKLASAVNKTSNAASAAVNRTSKPGSSDTATIDDNMADYLAVVTDVLADDDRSDDLADKGHLERHLGLGFAHGMGNGKIQSNGEGNSRSNPHNDDCRGNGHTGNPNGNGHEAHGNGNGFGHRDCGEPSPAD